MNTHSNVRRNETGKATKVQREKDRLMAIELRQLEDALYDLGLASGRRWVGCKPKA